MRTIDSLSNLSGRVAIVTGASGHLGKVISETLAEKGCSLYLIDNNQKNLKRISTKIQIKHHVKVLFYQADLEDEDSRASILTDFKKNYSKLDILINNAAFVGDSSMNGWSVPFEKQNISSWRRAIEVNLISIFDLAKLFYKLLKKSNHGSIINIGSIYGVIAPDFKIYENLNFNNPAAYSASKGGLQQLSRWLSTAFAPNIRVNCINPGGIIRNQPSKFIKSYIAKTPLGRMAKEEDMKGAIIYLASDLSLYVTGQCLMVDGGWTVW